MMKTVSLLETAPFEVINLFGNILYFPDPNERLQMLLHVDDLKPEMQLERDIELKAGSFLITLKELPDGKLSEEVIRKIRRFASQLRPDSYKVDVVGDEIVFEKLKKVLENDVNAVMKMIRSGRDFPNFLADSELREKVVRIVDKLISNPDIIRNMYDLKMQANISGQQGNYILDHSIRVTLLSIAVGLRMRFSIISLVNLGMASVMHDLGILETEIYPNLKQLDDLNTDQLEKFIEEHQSHSEKIFTSQQITMLPGTRDEILHILGNHHRPDLENITHKTTLLFYLVDLMDEMITPLPHKVRYNLTQVQKHILGKRFHGRLGLMNMLLGLVKLFKGQGLLWEIVQGLTEVFSMQELLVENYEEKMKNILDLCPFNPFKCATPFPATGGNALPRTIYCKKSIERGFFCEHVSQVRIEVQTSAGKMQSFFKCATLTGQLHELNKSGRKGEMPIIPIQPEGTDNSEN